MTEVSIGKAARELGVTPSTLRRWEAEGRIKPSRSPGNQRRYDLDELRSLAFKQPIRKAKKVTITYARVSTSARKANLETQEHVLELFCAAHGWEHETLRDIGSGLNYHRPGFSKLIARIECGEVERIVVNYRDRLVRFGFELVEQICKANGTQIVVVSDADTKSYEEELVEDVLSVVTVFSARLYGSRSHRTKKIVEQNRQLFTLDNGEEVSDAGQSSQTVFDPDQ